MNTNYDNHDNLYINNSKIFSLEPSSNITDEKIRETLRQLKILPTQEKARLIFWGLKDNWWKQIIDGRYHIYGKEVFDKGLHLGPVESGYLADVEKACLFVSEHFENLICLDLYKSIHHIACAHFKGKSNNTLMDQGKIDCFRENEADCQEIRPSYEGYEAAKKSTSLSLDEIINAMQQGAETEQKLIEELKKFGNKYNLKDKTPEFRSKENNSGCFILYKHPIFPLNVNIQWADENKNPFIDSIDRIKQFCRNLIVKIGLKAGFVENNLEQITEKIMGSYRESMRNLGIKTIERLNKSPETLEEVKKDYQKEAIKYIGTLYAELEWLHPWIDGQGRSDIILLNYLLSQEGLNPALLVKPFFSTFHPIDEWLTYLEQGIESWKKA